MSNRSVSDYVTFKSDRLVNAYKGRKIPMGALIEAYFDGDVDFHGDIEEFMFHRSELVDNTITRDHLKFVVTRLVPDVLIHSKEQDRRQVQETYDRGDDFYAAFLDSKMVYTSGIYESKDDTLEQAQTNKLDVLCRKLRMKPGERFLDIGSGWGALVAHAAKNYGVDATGVTISKNQTAWGTKVIEDAGVSSRARIVCQDYRDVAPNPKFDKISCVEMSEHVGIKRYAAFLEQVRDLMTDDGLFFLQIVGPRKGMRNDNPAWGLFMNKYIFPGADSAQRLSWVVDHLEKAKFEVHSIENVTVHYGLTIRAWYHNWIAHREEVVAAYGERWFRIWSVFLAWATRVGTEGESLCMQIVCNKARNAFDRTQWFGKSSLISDPIPLALSAPSGDADQRAASK